MLEAGVETDIAAKEGQTVLGKYGAPARATTTTTALDGKNYDCVIVPGGFAAPDRVRLLPEVLNF